ncbi:hypothetical protein A9Q81_24605 [Gammaproteobacteria bacterium 42_54_T18]|nr:hypothetical protein A9Q81_24605 [Gammaproteobacteria bacterium 42_54_T18]
MYGGLALLIDELPIIWFVTVTVTLNEDIYVIDIASGEMTNLTSTPKITEMTSSFSLDNQFVIYSATVPGADIGDGNNLGKGECVINLYKINLKTKEKSQVTHGNNCFSHPLYRPLL